MATSISQAQAKALADGFLDTLGSDEDLQPVETLGTLVQLAGELVDTAQENLNRADRVASGALSASLKILNPDIVGNSIQVDIEALYYYTFIDLGVKGTTSGNGHYAFKNNYVGKAMMKAIRKWVIREGLKMRATKKYSAITSREAKRKNISDTSTSTAYRIAAAVKRKGIRRSNFFTGAVKKIENTVADKLGAAFQIDIINSLPNNLNGNNNRE